MKKVIHNYRIDVNTFALLPGKHIDYDTIVIKDNTTKHIGETPFNLIKSACYDDWTSYEGRLQAIIIHTNFKQKVPILINIRKGIYFFPTHSPYNIDNSWIAYHHILKIDKVPKHLATKQNQSMIQFRNHQTLILNVPIQTLKTQYQRTFECMFRIKEAQGP